MNDKQSKSLLDVAQDVRKEHQAELEQGKLQMSASDAENEPPEEIQMAPDADDPNGHVDA